MNNNLCLKCDYSDHLIDNYKFQFNVNQVLSKENKNKDKFQSQFTRTFIKKHVKIQPIRAESFSDQDSPQMDISESNSK